MAHGERVVVRESLSPDQLHVDDQALGDMADYFGKVSIGGLSPVGMGPDLRGTTSSSVDGDEMVQDTSLAKQERDKAESDKAPQSVMENVLYGIKSSSSATSDANTTSPSRSGTNVRTGSPASSSSYKVPIGSGVVSTPQEPETIEEAPPASTSTLRQRIQAIKEARTQSNEAPRGLHAESTHALAHTTPATPISPGRGSGEDVERAHEQGAQAAAPPTQPPRLPLGHMDKEEMREKFALWVCLCDGDYPQMNVLTQLSLFHGEIRAKTKWCFYDAGPL